MDAAKQRDELIEKLIEAEIAKREIERDIKALRELIFVPLMNPVPEPAPKPYVPLKQPEPKPYAAPPPPPQPQPQAAPPQPALTNHHGPAPSMEIATRIVQEHAGPITIAALAELGGLSERQARGCISALLRDGTLRRCDDGYELAEAG